MPLGSARCTIQAAASAPTATIIITTRQPTRSPIQAASGMPATEATDQPMNTKVMCRPRCAGVLMKPITAAA